MIEPQEVAPEVSEIVPEDLGVADSIHATLRDSLQNIQSLSDVKDVFTGENEIIKNAVNALVELAAGFIPKLIAAILVLWIGLKLLKVLDRTLNKLMERQHLDVSLKGFLISFINVVLKILLIIMVMDIVGIKATSFIAIIGAAGLAVGMALQGTLQNFAGGVIILIMKPYKVGDYINGAGYEGFVKEIRMFNTILNTFDKKTIIIPNTQLATGTLINFSKERIRRVDVKVSIAYGQSVEKAREVLLRLAQENPDVEKTKETLVVVTALGNSSLDLTLRTWATIDNYWKVFEGMNETVYTAFQKEGIVIPFPQIQVHMDKNNE